MDLQKLLDSLSESNRRTRSEYHVTLGEAISCLSGIHEDVPVFAGGMGVGSPHSYRGYYSDLALAPQSESTAGGLLLDLKAALTRSFEGYKGGDFLMGEDTPLWVACYGCCGVAVVDIVVSPETVTLKTKEL